MGVEHVVERRLRVAELTQPSARELDVCGAERDVSKEVGNRSNANFAREGHAFGFLHLLRGDEAPPLSEDLVLVGDGEVDIHRLVTDPQALFERDFARKDHAFRPFFNRNCHD